LVVQPLASFPPDPARLRVLIVDDSAVARAVIQRIVDATGRYVVAASVSTARAAIAVLAREQVDYVLLDINMPGIDGLTALPDLIAAGQGARVLIVSGQASDGASATVQALTLGAADTLFKPASGERMNQFGEALIDKLDRLSDTEAVPAVRLALPMVRPRSPPLPAVSTRSASSCARSLPISSCRSSSPSICRHRSCPISRRRSPSLPVARARSQSIGCGCGPAGS
jgi:chemotaxis response regulator CheB